MSDRRALYCCGAAGMVLALAMVSCKPRSALSASGEAAPIAIQPVAPAGSRESWRAGTGLVDLNPGPVVQFERSCARCHGPQGSQFDEGLARMDLHALRRELVEMMVGPAEMHPSLAQVNAMTAYILAIRAGQPFVVVNNAAAFTSDQQTALRGEATAETAVEIHSGSQVTPVTVKDLTWRVSNPPSPPFSIVAVKAGKLISFGFPLQQWSVQVPASEPASTQNIPMPSGLP